MTAFYSQQARMGTLGRRKIWTRKKVLSIYATPEKTVAQYEH